MAIGGSVGLTFAPGLGRGWLDRRLGRQRLVDVDPASVAFGSVIGFGEGDAVQPDLDFQQGRSRRSPRRFDIPLP